MSDKSKDDILGVTAVGTLAATMAAIAHEAIGHGVGCYAVGGRVSLLTSIFFDCDGATALTDAAGPIGSFLAAVGAAVLLQLMQPKGWWLVFLYLSFVINAGWFSGQLVYSGALDRDDWHFMALELRWPVFWRVLAIATGVGAYWGSLRFIRRWQIDRSTVRRAYLAAAASAAVAGLFWMKAPLASAWEGVLAVGVAPLGFLLSGPRRSRRKALSQYLGRRWSWVTLSAILYVLFLVFEARGVGRLA